MSGFGVIVILFGGGAEAPPSTDVATPLSTVLAKKFKIIG